MTRKERKILKEAVLSNYDDTENIMIKNGEILVYGRMPNSTQVDWWFLGYEIDYNNKGLAGLGLE